MWKNEKATFRRKQIKMFFNRKLYNIRQRLEQRTINDINENYANIYSISKAMNMKTKVRQ